MAFKEVAKLSDIPVANMKHERWLRTQTMKRTISSFYKPLLALLAVVITVGLVACASTSSPAPTDGAYNPVIDPANFVAKIDNQYYSLTPGTTFTYRSETEDGIERNEVVVTDETRIVLGVMTTVIWDRVWLDDKLLYHLKCLS